MAVNEEGEEDDSDPDDQWESDSNPFKEHYLQGTKINRNGENAPSPDEQRSDYFEEVDPEQWSFIGFCRRRSASFDFTNNFRKESFKLQKCLDILARSNSPQERTNANRLLSEYKVRIRFLDG
ncbi:hypothetical protein BC936DRAFT_139625 [Jimgerdemannia flammicorona]|uniref:Uncharacterized protein n=1 Tax=Jimgerdemannia flammicorona TaxID=994334 RepID=A0A433B9J6_9FUNG|nr:hypothetical protein BC936DRAFT_139625 [Jimgerdemannia flammicorona]